MALTLGIRSVGILSLVRKTFLLVALLALALPVAGFSALAVKRAGEGTLTVEDGHGRVVVQARGGVIGRLERGTLTIFDTTPNDLNEPVVTGDDRPLRFLGENGIRYAGTGIRFRILGGGFRVVIDGRGIDLSVVARGTGSIKGDDVADPGVYSLEESSDCRLRPASCEPLPQIAKRFQLGGPERDRERDLVRPLAD
jgi:hypothetical protein